MPQKDAEAAEFDHAEEIGFVVDGRIVRKQRSRKLTDYCDRYRSRKDVQPLLEEILRPLNAGRLRPESTLTVAQYVEQCYLPNVEAELKPSTIAGYKDLWDRYLAPRLQRAILRDYRCADATRLLTQIHDNHSVGRKTLRHCKALLHAIFTFAKQQGVLEWYQSHYRCWHPSQGCCLEAYSCSHCRRGRGHAEHAYRHGQGRNRADVLRGPATW